MSDDDAQRVDNAIGIDLFVYNYAVAAKNRRPEIDDIGFMAQLHHALGTFKQRKADAEAAANTAFDFDEEPSPPPKPEKAVKKDKSKGKAKVSVISTYM
jgi:hypothetical protein